MASDIYNEVQKQIYVENLYILNPGSCEVCMSDNRKKTINEGEVYDIKYLEGTFGKYELPRIDGSTRRFLVGGVQIDVHVEDLLENTWIVTSVGKKKDPKTILDELREDFYDITGKYRREIL